MRPARSKTSVADVRVTQLEFADSLGNLPRRQVLWSCGTSSMDEASERAGMQIDVIGGRS